jgi:hypothetical protein
MNIHWWLTIGQRQAAGWRNDIHLKLLRLKNKKQIDELAGREDEGERLGTITRKSSRKLLKRPKLRSVSVMSSLKEEGYY